MGQVMSDLCYYTQVNNNNCPDASANHIIASLLDSCCKSPSALSFTQRGQAVQTSDEAFQYISVHIKLTLLHTILYKSAESQVENNPLNQE